MNGSGRWMARIECFADLITLDFCPCGAYTIRSSQRRKEARLAQTLKGQTYLMAEYDLETIESRVDIGPSYVMLQYGTVLRDSE